MMATQAAKMSGEQSQGGPGSELTKKVTGTVEDTREFLHDVRVEMKQVTWPTKDDVVSTTWVVIATVAFFGFFLWLVDLGVQRGVSIIFKKFGV
jgi:preprotein translocase subunit SecE